MLVEWEFLMQENRLERYVFVRPITKKQQYSIKFDTASYVRDRGICTLSTMSEDLLRVETPFMIINVAQVGVHCYRRITCTKQKKSEKQRNTSLLLCADCMRTLRTKPV